MKIVYNGMQSVLDGLYQNQNKRVGVRSCSVTCWKEFPDVISYSCKASERKTYLLWEMDHDNSSEHPLPCHS